VLRSFVASVVPVLLVLAIGGAASAQTRVVLATPDPTLETALDAALAPWNVSIVVVDPTTTTDRMPSAAERGAQLARDHQAAAVTWISIDASGAAALWMYDPASTRVVARPLPVAPPFDEPTADAVALSIKTLLRHSTAAPAAERIVDPPPPSEWRVELGAGARALATQPSDVEARFVLAGSVFPTALGSILGFSLSARAGTGIAAMPDTDASRFGAFDVALGVRACATLHPVVDLTFGLEIGASVLWLAGVKIDGMRRSTEVDVDPSGTIWAAIGVRPTSWLRIALRLGAFVEPVTRSYAVTGHAFFSTQVAAPFAELVFELPLDGGRIDVP
jgi:hypothetical protein